MQPERGVECGVGAATFVVEEDLDIASASGSINLDISSTPFSFAFSVRKAAFSGLDLNMGCRVASRIIRDINAIFCVVF